MNSNPDLSNKISHETSSLLYSTILYFTILYLYLMSSAGEELRGSNK